MLDKGKSKVHPRTGHEGPKGEYGQSFTLSLTSALDGVGGQRHAPAALPPRKTRYPLYRRLGGPHDRSGRVRKISPLPGYDRRTVQTVTSRYTDWAIPAHAALDKTGTKCTVTLTVILQFPVLSAQAFYSFWYVYTCLRVCAYYILLAVIIRCSYTCRPIPEVARLLVLWVRISLGARMFVW